MYPDGRPEEAAIVSSSPDSLTFLEVKEDSNGARRTYLRTKHFSHLESFNHVIGLWKILKTIRESRLAFLGKKSGADIETFLQVDRDKIAGFSRPTGFEVSV
jgi:hypothetical protein